MNLKNIKSIVNSDSPYWENQLLVEIAKDKDAIRTVLKILDIEREHNNMMISNLNALLSKVDCALDNPALNKENFMQKEINEFYMSHIDEIKHCFKSL